MELDLRNPAIRFDVAAADVEELAAMPSPTASEKSFFTRYRSRKLRSQTSFQKRDELAKAICDQDKGTIRTILEETENLPKLLQRELEPSKRYMNVFRGLIVHTPDIAKEVLDRLLVESGDCETCMHRLNYGFLENVYIPEEDTGGATDVYTLTGSKERAKIKPFTTNLRFMFQKHCLAHMVKHNQEELLDHPIVRRMLHSSWHLYRWLFYAGLITWLLYIGNLLAVISFRRHPFFYTNMMDQANKVDSCLLANSSCCSKYMDILNTWKSNYDSAQAAEIIIGIQIAVNLLSEASQMALTRGYYFRTPERILTLLSNILSIFLLTNTAVYTVPLTCYQGSDNSTVTASMRSMYMHENWQWEMGIIGVALSWTTFLFYVRKIPHSGIYIIIFLELAKRFFSFCFILVILLLGFGSVFLMVFPRSCPFQDLSYSTMSSLLMTAGEYSFETMMCESGPLASTWLLKLCFASIIFVMYFIVINMVIGLAVDDIKEIQQQAVFQKLKLKATIVLNYEISVPFFALRRCLKFEELVSCESLDCKKRKSPPKKGLEDQVAALSQQLVELQDRFDQTISNLDQRIMASLGQRDNDTRMRKLSVGVPPRSTSIVKRQLSASSPKPRI